MDSNTKKREEGVVLKFKEEEKEEIEKLIERVIGRGRKNWGRGMLCEYHGGWYPLSVMRGIIASQKLFKAEEGDIILAGVPKTGTTWLKALIFSIVNRGRYPPEQSPLLTTHPQDLVTGLEFNHFNEGLPKNLHLQLSSPRIFSTHALHAALPHSILNNNDCRIVYACRNPLDAFVSLWHFSQTNSDVNTISGNDDQTTVPPYVEEAFAKYCKGEHPFGPFWKHVLEYWKMSIKNPQKVLFMRYEDMKEDIVSEVKRLAMFLGYAFTEEEEEQGLVEEITRLCSFGNLKSLEVNQKNEVRRFGFPSSAYFRKGEVGDHANLLTPSMVDTLTKLIQLKFAGPGFDFKSK